MTKMRNPDKDTHKINSAKINGTVAIISQQKLDPKLTELFSSSFGPVQSQEGGVHGVETPKALQWDCTNELVSRKTARIELGKSEIGDSNDVDNRGSQLRSTNNIILKNDIAKEKEEKSSRRKRKHKDDYDDLEAAYMRKLEYKEVKDQVNNGVGKKPKRERNEDEIDEDKDSSASSVDSGSEDEELGYFDSAEDISQQNNAIGSNNGELRKSDNHRTPQHETTSLETQDRDMEKSLRTVFAGNISNEVMTSKSSKKMLLKHFSSFLSELPNDSGPHKIESIRFRSTAYSNNTPRKAAYISKDLMSATTKSTNAYIVFTSKLAAREAAKRLNGTIILDRHVRVDEVAHPAKVDHKRCVFVGRLGYVDDESNMAAAANGDDDSAQENGQKRTKKAKQPGDVEEGLWRQFSRAGTVESVRVVRDAKTRVGKGFAFVQFTDPNAVEAALLYNEKSFPPLLPRKLRVIRAKAVKRNKPPPSSSYAAFATRNRSTSDIDPKLRSMQGRALNMLGRAGAAQVWKQKQQRRLGNNNNNNNSLEKDDRQRFVFEGVRAREGDRGMTRGRNKKRKGGTKTDGRGRGRKRQRTTAWKARLRT